MSLLGKLIKYVFEIGQGGRSNLIIEIAPLTFAMTFYLFSEVGSFMKNTKYICKDRLQTFD